MNEIFQSFSVNRKKKCLKAALIKCFCNFPNFQKFSRYQILQLKSLSFNSQCHPFCLWFSAYFLWKWAKNIPYPWQRWLLRIEQISPILNKARAPSLKSYPRCHHSHDPGFEHRHSFPQTSNINFRRWQVISLSIHQSHKRNKKKKL